MKTVCWSEERTMKAIKYVLENPITHKRIVTTDKDRVTKLLAKGWSFASMP